MDCLKIASPASETLRRERLITLARRCEQTRSPSQSIDDAIAREFADL